MSRYSEETRQLAKALYLRKYTPEEIADRLNLPSRRIVYYWAEKFSWRDLLGCESIEDAIGRRIQLLTERNGKTDLEMRELEMLIGQHVKLLASRHKHDERMAQIAAEASGINTGDVSDGAHTQEGKKRRGRGKNNIDGITADDFKPFLDKLFRYQLRWREAKLASRIRNILKSRQVGATWYFAFEAFEDAVLTGDPQIFLSASRPQAEMFRSYIVAIAKELFNITLTGNPIVLSNGAELRFLSTNSNTAQSYHGHVYIDEYFWIRDFKKLNDLASAMATHKKWRKTYFSTPSAKSHQAYPFWTGSQWKKGKKDREDIVFPDEAAMRKGVLCPDKQWRNIVTIEDACRDGADRDLFDLEGLREEYSDQAFRQLYLCEFIDDGASVFKFDQIGSCAVDSATWQDFNPGAARPFGNREVWGGYDPARTGDTATFVIIAPPILAVERFRLLEHYRWRGMNFKFQADSIKKIKDKYNLSYIGIDITGIGRGVYEMVLEFARRETHAIHYGVETKNRLVLKMIDVVEGDRFEYPESEKHIPASFLAIKRTTTKSGNAMTFVADRSIDVGHADVFWAAAHAIDNEPLNYENKKKSSWVIQ